MGSKVIKNSSLQNMKLTHLKTPSCLCTNMAFVVLGVMFLLLTQNNKQAHSFAYSGNETDHVALLAIKSQLVDRAEGVLSSWNDSIHHCNWAGVMCGRKHNRVTSLDLNTRGLAGTISPFIGNLSFLKNVSLSDNRLQGVIPPSLGNISRLQELWLDNNSFVGEIPLSLSSCTDLISLDISFNELVGKLPAELSTLSKLQYFGVGNNKLTGPLFDIIQNLTSLQTIFAAFNTFTGTIPNNIGDMRNLNILAVVGNHFTGTLPLSLFNLSALHVLDLTDNFFHGEVPPHLGFSVPDFTWLGLAENNFSGLIPTITNFTSLESILFNENHFSGRIPPDFHQFHNLLELVLSSNHLKGDIKFIETLVNCTQLTTLELSSNEFSGVLPVKISNLSTTLQTLSIGENLISGLFPPDITNLVNLQNLDTGNMELTNSIPHDIGRLKYLEILTLTSNALTGKIPDSLGNLSYLSELYLNDNSFKGGIPENIGNCKSLLQLSLSHNELNGSLDSKLFTGSAALTLIDLSYNRLTGPLPLEISKKTSLVALRLSKNMFSGVLPEGLGDCTELQILFMGQNSFHGDIPSSYSSLTSIQEIDFSQNNLSGPIPAFFSKISTIYYLNLSHNDFQGSVPTNSVFANASAVFLDGNSNLCGGIPELHLPKCIDKEVKKGKETNKSRALKLIIPVVSALVGVLAIAAGLYMACERKEKIPLSLGLEMKGALMKVSYNMLLKATYGFSAENLLGSGSFGSVFKGILDGKTVAVKVLNLQHHAAYKSFMAECRALRNIRHRNLVSLITACSSIDFLRNDFRALVYEFMPNGSLRGWLDGAVGNLNLRERVEISIDVAHAINYLHHECETPVVHGDLKPSNILLDHDMVAHVGDFGLARFLTQPRHPNQTSTIGIAGTIGYAAPEYGLGSEASTAGDVYSYGILLLELMTGKTPTDSAFEGDDNLHTYAEAALPNQVLQIVDPSLEEANLTDDSYDRREFQDEQKRKLKCIISVISVGISCSKHLTEDRIRISEALNMLLAARDSLLSANNRRRHPARG